MKRDTHKFNDSFTCATTAANPLYDEPVTIEKIQHSMRILKKFECPTIYIWNGLKPIVDGLWPWHRDFMLSLLPEKPQIHESQLLADNDDKCYIVAGIGIIANHKIAEMIQKLNLNLLWTDYPTNLEEQKKMFKEIFDRLFE